MQPQKSPFITLNTLNVTISSLPFCSKPQGICDLLIIIKMYVPMIRFKNNVSLPLQYIKYFRKATAKYDEILMWQRCLMENF